MLDFFLKPRGSFYIIFVFLIFFLLPQKSVASSLHTLSDKMSRHAPSTPADHEIKFTTPSGINNSGEYLRIIFDSGFDLSSIQYTDIDLYHGPITGFEKSEVLRPTAVETAWGVNVSGNQIDFTHPTNNANGDILANDKVVIRIGLNAQNGQYQIINPSTTGSKIITLSGNYGDSGKLAVAIFEDQLVVGGQTENSPPNPVTLYSPSNITANSMVLSWSKNIDIDFDRYELYMAENTGVTNVNGSLVCLNSLNSETSCIVSSLTGDREYFFVLYVYDTEGLYSASNEVMAKTLSVGGGAPPQPAMPTLDERLCPIFLSNTLLSGTKPLGTIIFINGSAEGIDYPTLTSWNSLVDLNLGNNLFLIWARDNYGQNSEVLNATVTRCEVGDTDCNGIVDDFDLSGLAYHWNTAWCYADFNEDSIVDDFDLSGLAAHWDKIY